MRILDYSRSPRRVQQDSRISVQLITEECLRKLDTKQQTNALLNLVWRDSASEEVFTMMASICHTLMVQHRMMVPKVRSAAGNAGDCSRTLVLGVLSLSAVISGSVPIRWTRGLPVSVQ